MATGKVKRLVRDRGFGFIKVPGESTDLFFHMSGVRNDAGFNFDSINEGDELEFEVEEGVKGSRAVDITRA